MIGTCFKLLHTYSVENAADFCHASIMAKCGQDCSAGSRNYVHADIYDNFVAEAVSRANNRTVGDPWSEESINGCIVSL